MNQMPIMAISGSQAFSIRRPIWPPHSRGDPDDSEIDSQIKHPSFPELDQPTKQVANFFNGVLE